MPRVRRTLRRLNPLAAALACVALLVATCWTSVPPSQQSPEWRMPEQGNVLAAPFPPRLEARPAHQVVHVPPLTRLARELAPNPRRVVVTAADRRDGAQPPGRRCYRRTIHEDRDEPA